MENVELFKCRTEYRRIGVIISCCAVIGHFCAAVFGGDVDPFLVYFMDEARWFLGALIIPITTFSDD